jgi:sarcosine oxidase subunit gamma
MVELSATIPINLPTGRRGCTDGEPGVVLKMVPSCALVSVIARQGTTEALAAAVKRAFDVDLPMTPRLARGRGISFLWCGHRHWFALSDDTAGIFGKLSPEIRSLAALSDQSDSRLVVELSGPAARATLTKLTPIDLHPRAFRVGETAVTMFGHIGAQITLIDDQPTYDLMFPRSFADSFLHSVSDAADEFGVEIV